MTSDSPAAPVPFDVLVPAPGPGQVPADDDAALARLYPHPAQGRTAGAFVRANMIATVDGAVRGPDGVSGSINGAADGRVFQVLRALADVVLVGAGTVRAEGYETIDVPAGLKGLRRAAGRRDDLVLAVVTRSGGVPPSLVRPGVVVVTGSRGAQRVEADHSAARPDVIVAGEETVDLARAVAALAARGLGRVLCEGGPHLLGDALRAGVLDELCLTRTPELLGVEGLGLTGAAPLERTALRLDLLMRAPDDVLLSRWGVTG